ncbi:MAG: ABC transporter ATP-binding protein [Actinomycetota bacterium]
MTSPLLTFDGVTRYFGGIVAVDDCSFTVGEGELVGMVGPNGAGKSTLFNLATGYLEPSRGTVTVLGVPTHRHPAAALARQGLSRTFQTPVAFRELTVLDNVMVAAPVARPLLSGLMGGWRQQERSHEEGARALLEKVGLSQRADTEAGELSGGELRMLEVARQLFTGPRLLLLDEPTAGVAPHLQTTLGDLIRSVHADGVAVVVVEHNLGFLLELVDRVICLANGRVIADGTPEQIRRDPQVVAAYLGEHS